ncbi:MAG TPA: peptidoglycan-associated lipoprotein Pal [Candidatus Sulfotelmatobacter sp.]
MTSRTLKMLSLVTALSVMLLVGCSKKVAKATPPPPPSPPAPTATLAASPDVLQQGQWTTLTWQTTNANDISIAGLGTLSASGSRSVDPNTSMTYTLVAKGPGGSQDASARVTVNPKPEAKVVTPQPSEADLFAKNVKDVFFDFNKAAVRPDEVSVAQTDAQFLAQHPDIKVLLEGHCDDRGSEEYNLALGDSRAHSLQKSLEQQGVSADRIQTISYGKEKPFCSADDEQCWQTNRRDHVTLAH